MNPGQHVNPYIAGSPVTGTEMFYGREDVFSFIQRNLIGRHRDTPIVLYGQRRTGKTSVLYQLHRHLDPGYRCIFIDLHGLNLQGMGNLLLGIASSISRGLRRDHQLTVELPDRGAFLADPRSAFETMFLDGVWSALAEDHLVLMMDEAVRLDEEVRAGRLEREIFDYLRHLMQHLPALEFHLLPGQRPGGNGEGLRLFVQRVAVPPDLVPRAGSRPRANYPARTGPLPGGAAGGQQDPADHLRPPVLHPARVPLHVRLVVARPQTRDGRWPTSTRS